MTADLRGYWSQSLRGELWIGMDSGARTVMIPSENRRDFADLPAEVVDKLQIVFYSNPSQAVWKAMEVGRYG